MSDARAESTRHAHISHSDKTLNDKKDDGTKNELIFDLMKRRFDAEIDVANKLDSKAGSMVGFVSIIVGLTLGGGSVFSGNKLESFVVLSNDYAAILYFAGITILLVSVGCALRALKVTKWKLTPDAGKLTAILRDSEYNYLKILRDVTEAMGASVANSERINNHKVTFIELSWYSILSGLVLILASYVVLVSNFGMVDNVL